MQRLEALRRVGWVLQGEPGSISLLKRDSVNAFVEFLSIGQSVFFFTRDADGGALPPNVMFEAQIGELMITKEDADQTGAIDHGQYRYSIVKVSPGEPGIFPPMGLNRFWRFWLAPLEEVL